MNDLDAWCDEELPDLYDEGMFDSEEISEEVWETVQQLAQTTLLDHIEDEEERDDLLDQILDVARAWFRAHHDLVLEAIEPLPSATIEALTSKPQTAQHTADWYAERRNRLTASEFSQILDGRRGALLRKKLSTEPSSSYGSAVIGIAQEDGEMNATTWGHRFESITRRIYELELAGVGTVNDTMGRFTHPTIPWLSASPDGLVTKGPLAGRLVEIKCPKTRQPGEFVPQEYYVQMQLQMEVCDLDVVDFVEAQYGQRPLKAISPADEAAIEKASWKGRIDVYGYLESPETWTYKYSKPVEDLLDAKIETCELPLLESSVWWLTGWFPRTVLRNQVWWSAIGWPAAELFWAQVESGRAVGTSVAKAVNAMTPVDEFITHV